MTPTEYSSTSFPPVPLDQEDDSWSNLSQNYIYEAGMGVNIGHMARDTAQQDMGYYAHSTGGHYDHQQGACKPLSCWRSWLLLPISIFIQIIPQTARCIPVTLALRELQTCLLTKADHLNRLNWQQVRLIILFTQFASDFCFPSFSSSNLRCGSHCQPRARST
jgi:hypothetical protein